MNAPDKSPLRTLFRFFKSVQLAIGLLIYLALTSLLSTLIPQGQEAAFYARHYSPVVSWLIMKSGFDNFYLSLLFIFPSLVFTLNLLVCTANRLVQEFRGRRKKRFGPDLIHLGLLLLIVGGFITLSQRREGFFYLNAGVQYNLADKYKIELKDFTFQKYPDGRPREWISTVSLRDITTDEVVVEAFPIEVNKPLSYRGIKVYQTDYAEEPVLFLKAADGEIFAVNPGHPIVRDGDVLLVFEGMEVTAEGAEHILIREYNNRQPASIRQMVSGDYLGEFQIDDIRITLSTGLTAVIDPGYRPVLIACIVIIFGLFLTYIQKIGDTKHD